MYATTRMNGLSAAAATTPAAPKPVTYTAYGGQLWPNTTEGKADLAKFKAQELANKQAAAVAAAAAKAAAAKAAADKVAADKAAAAQYALDLKKQADANAQKLKDIAIAEKQSKIDAALMVAKAQAEAIAPKQEAAQGFAPVAQISADTATTSGDTGFDFEKYKPILLGVGGLMALMMLMKTMNKG